MLTALLKTASSQAQKPSRNSSRISNIFKESALNYNRKSLSASNTKQNIRQSLLEQASSKYLDNDQILQQQKISHINNDNSEIKRVPNKQHTKQNKNHQQNIEQNDKQDQQSIAFRNNNSVCHSSNSQINSNRLYHEQYQNLFLNSSSLKTSHQIHRNSNNLGSSMSGFYNINNNCFQNTNTNYSSIASVMNKQSLNDHQLFLDQLQSIIFTQVKQMQSKQLKGNYILEHVTDDLQIELLDLEAKIKDLSQVSSASSFNKGNKTSDGSIQQQILKLRMHAQGICKILVFVHGKSQYRLVRSHYYIGQAYRSLHCYQQAIDHFTISLKKNTKLTQIKQTKIYHSFILTSLSECYYQLQLYSQSLQILLRAYQIQQCYVNSQLKINNTKTIKLISQCYVKMKNYHQAIQYMQKTCLLVEKLKGVQSREYIEVKYEKAVAIGEEGNLIGAIEELKVIIELLKSNSVTLSNLNAIQRNVMQLKFNKKLSEFLEKFGDYESEIECLKYMLRIVEFLINSIKPRDKNIINKSSSKSKSNSFYNNSNNNSNNNNINNTINNNKTNQIAQTPSNQQTKQSNPSPISSQQSSLNINFNFNFNRNQLIKLTIIIKKKIIVISIKQSQYQVAVQQLQQVLELQQQKYGSESVQAGKTMKMLGLVHLHLGNQIHAEEYLKKCYKINEQRKKNAKGNSIYHNRLSPTHDNASNREQMKSIQKIYKLLGYGQHQCKNEQKRQSGIGERRVKDGSQGEGLNKRKIQQQRIVSI